MWISTMSAAGKVFLTAEILGIALVAYYVLVAPFFMRGSKDRASRRQVLLWPAGLVFALLLISAVIYAVAPS